MSPPTLNVLGRPLQPCSFAPITGFFRDGCCRTGAEDHGLHVICVVMTPAFLAFSRAQGNDLSTPVPEYNFPGLRPGDRWCLCALRWKEAWLAGKAPGVVLESTQLNALGIVSLDQLREHAVSADRTA